VGSVAGRRGQPSHVGRVAVEVVARNGGIRRGEEVGRGGLETQVDTVSRPQREPVAQQPRRRMWRREDSARSGPAAL